MKLKIFVIVLFLLTIGCYSMVAQEKDSSSKYHLVVLKCEIRDNLTKKLLSGGTMQMYSFPDTLKVGHNSVTFHAGEGYSDRKSLQIGKYLARFFVMNFEFSSDVKAGV